MRCERSAGDVAGRSAPLDQADPASFPFASRAWAYQFDASGVEGGHDLLEAIDDGADRAVRRFHPLNRRQRNPSALGEVLLV